MDLNDKPHQEDVLLQQTNLGVKDDTDDTLSKETTTSDDSTEHSGTILSGSTSSIKSTNTTTTSSSKTTTADNITEKKISFQTLENEEQQHLLIEPTVEVATANVNVQLKDSITPLDAKDVALTKKNNSSHLSRKVSKRKGQRDRRRATHDIEDGVRPVKKQGSTVSAASGKSFKGKKRREQVGKKHSCSTRSSPSGKSSKKKKRRNKRSQTRELENGCKVSSARPSSTNCQNRPNMDQFSENATIDDSDNHQVMPGAFRCDNSSYDESSSYEDTYTLDDSYNFEESQADDGVAVEVSTAQVELASVHSLKKSNAEDQSTDVHINICDNEAKNQNDESSPSQDKQRFSWRSIPTSIFITVIASLFCCALVAIVSLMLLIWVVVSSRNDGTIANVYTDPPTTSPVPISEECLVENLFNPSSTCRNGTELVYVISTQERSACDHESKNAIPCGGTLASFTSQEEFDIMMSLFESFNYDTPHWLGASRTGDYNDDHFGFPSFSWNDGSSFFANWDSDQPDQAFADPAHIYATIKLSGYMADYIGCGFDALVAPAIFLLPWNYETIEGCKTDHFYVPG